jgi:TPR repeat protein
MLEKAANNGDVRAQYSLGEIYVHGMLCAPSYEEAEKWWKMASKKSDDAKASLAVLYLKENKNYKEAEKLLKEAAENGNVLAQSNLGNLYLQGYPGIGRNDQEAFKWLSKAASVGDMNAQNDLYYYYAEGIIVKKDILKAIRLLESSARQGFPKAYMNLGFLYSTGQYEVEKDYVKAEENFKMLVNMGFFDYYFCLGHIYEEGGYGIEKDEKKAYLCYCRLLKAIRLQKQTNKENDEDIKIIKDIEDRIKRLEEKFKKGGNKEIIEWVTKYLSM